MQRGRGAVFLFVFFIHCMHGRWVVSGAVHVCVSSVWCVWVNSLHQWHQHEYFTSMCVFEWVNEGNVLKGQKHSISLTFFRICSCKVREAKYRDATTLERWHWRSFKGSLTCEEQAWPGWDSFVVAHCSSPLLTTPTSTGSTGGGRTSALYSVVWVWRFDGSPTSSTVVMLSPVFLWLICWFVTMITQVLLYRCSWKWVRGWVVVWDKPP